jgi:FixJ family two-component response regulator
MTDRSTPSGKNLILVADDENIILRMATTILSNAGFRAIVVTDGIEGVRTFRELPGGGGLEMAQAILEVDPNAKIIFMSGYSDAALEVQARTRFPFIRKPFLSTDLLSKIEETLRGPDDRSATAGS